MRAFSGFLLRFAVHLVTVFSTFVVSVAVGQPADHRPFAVGFTFGGYPVSQHNVSAGFKVAGYRLVNSGFDDPFTPSAVSANAPVSASCPGSSFFIDYCPDGRLGVRLDFSRSVTSDQQYANVLFLDTVDDRLRLKLRSSAANVLAFYRILTYKGHRKVGVELTTSAGLSLCSISEHMDVRFPATDTASTLGEVAGSSQLKDGGFSALFGFDAVVRIGNRFSFIPARILWGLSVVRPSFDELRFINGPDRRVLPARNYDLSGLFWQLGAAYHF